jgi:predicted RND superfamily exporter protein
MKNWKQIIIDLVTKKSILCIVISSLIALGLISQAPKLKSDFSYRIWFMKDDPLLKKFDAFERQFGNDENVAIVIHSPNGIFDKESVEIIQKITEKMWLAPDVIRVDSLSNHNYTQTQGDEIFVDPFLPEGEDLNPEYLEIKKQQALNDEIMPKYLVSENAKTAMIYAKMKPALEKIPMYKDTVDYARSVLAEVNDGEHEFHVTGSASINVTFQEVSEEDLKVMMPILILLVILFLSYSFRGIGGVIYSFLIIGVSIMATFGFAVTQGYTFNVMISSVPTTLIAICIADVIHVLMSYFIYLKQGYDTDNALTATLNKNLTPTLLTSVTTSIGFFSLAPTKIVPVANMGVMDGFGTLMAWFFTIFLVLPLLKFFPLKNVKVWEHRKGKGEDYIHPKALAFTLWIQRFRKQVIAVSLILVAGSVYLALKSDVNSDPYNFFTEEVALKIANDTMERELGGSMGAELAVDSGVEDGVKDPEFLRKLEKLQNWLLEHGYIKKVVSVLDIIKGMNRSLNGGKEEFYSIADSKNVIAQQLFLYTMSLPQGMDINNRITLDNRMTRMTIMQDIHDSKTVLAEFEKWENYAQSIGLKAHVTGKLPLYQKMNGYIVNTYFTSISMALFLVSLIMVFVFRSFKLGMISMIPNTVPLIIGAAIMYLLGKDIDMGTVVITAVCLGIAVDDTIHFLANYKKHIANGDTVVDAIAKVLTYTGPALILTTIILVCGFGTFMFATFIPNVNFGVMTAVILTGALVTDFTLLPAILLPNAESDDKSKA